MTAEFWNNTIWYILLGISTVIEMFFVLYKAKCRSHALAVFIILSGMAFSYEVTIFCFFKAYDYYPMLIPQSRIDDGLAGNLFSQFSVTATALLIAVLNLRYYWYFIFAGSYGMIEELFLKLGIYTHHWYQTWMTVFGLLFFFWIAKKMYGSNFARIKRNSWYTFMLFGLYTLHMPTVLWIQILAGIFVPSVNVLPDPMNSYALICLINLVLISIACVIVYYSRLKGWWKSVIVLTLYGAIYLAYKGNYIYIKEGWFLICSTIDIFGMFLCISILDTLMMK